MKKYLLLLFYKVFKFMHLHYYGPRMTGVLGGRFTQLRFCLVCHKVQIRQKVEATREEFIAFCREGITFTANPTPAVPPPIEPTFSDQLPTQTAPPKEGGYL